MMFKSCNVLSALFINALCSTISKKTETVSRRKLVIGLTVALGVVLYSLAGAQNHRDKPINKYGLLLLVTSLICDGLLPDFQAEIKVKYNPSSIYMFTAINKWKFMIALVYSICAN